VAAAQKVLGEYSRPSEQERLLSQVTELRLECRRLSGECEQQEERLASQGKDIGTYEHRCGHFEEVIRQLQRRLSCAERLAAKAESTGGSLGQSAEELCGQLALADHEKNNLKARLDAELRAGGGARHVHAGLERHADRVSGVVQGMREQLLSTVGQLRNAKVESAPAAAALDLGLATSRQESRGAAADAAAALAEAWDVGSELAQVRNQLTTFDEHLEAGRKHVRAQRAAAQGRAEVLARRLRELVAETAREASEARGCAEARAALKQTEAETEDCRLELGRRRATEAALSQRAHCQGNATRAKDAQAIAMRTALGANGDASELITSHAGADAANDALRESLEADISHAREAVTNAGRGLEAIRSQLRDLQTLSAQLQASENDALAYAAELKEEARSEEARHAAALRELQEVRSSEEDASTLRRRQAVLPFPVRSPALCREAPAPWRVREGSAAPRPRRHRGAERKAGKGRAQPRRRVPGRGGRAPRGAGRARGAPRGPRRGAARLGAGTRGGPRVCASEGGAAWRSTAPRAAAEPRRLATELRSRAEGLQAEHGRLQVAVRRVEALNAGLRAQVHVLQHRPDGEEP